MQNSHSLLRSSFWTLDWGIFPLTHHFGQSPKIVFWMLSHDEEVNGVDKFCEELIVLRLGLEAHFFGSNLAPSLSATSENVARVPCLFCLINGDGDDEDDDCGG